MSNGSKYSFPRLAYGGTVGSRGVAVMPSATMSLTEHLAIFGKPDPYYHSLHHLKKQLEKSEIHGRGGAGFPLSRKIAGFENFQGKVIVVANGSEGEYLSHKDETLMIRHPHLVLDGLAMLSSAFDSRLAYVHLEVSKVRVRQAVEKALAERRGLDPMRIEITTTMPGVGYIAGSESAVISAINRQGGRPTYLPDRPILRGVRKRPTLIANVETLAQLALLARFGATWFTSIGYAGDSGTRLLTVSLPDGGYSVVEVVAGTSFNEVLSLVGVQPDQVSCGLLGGYFGQVLSTDRLWSLRASQSFLREAGLSLGAGVIALAEGCPVAETARIIEYLAGESAGQCGPCYFGLPELARVWQEMASGKVSASSLNRASELCDQIVGRGGCAMPDGAVLLSRSSLNGFLSEILSHQSGTCTFSKSTGTLVPSVEVLSAR